MRGQTEEVWGWRDRGEKGHGVGGGCTGGEKKNEESAAR